ncbi:hypothetical protein SAMN04489712_10477 [Thermomonospora echinospora]|uniref:Uncharacterized protein n=1 Tax=Thermomonospora echinospora TaxID=1992 RepID=A0A1H5YNH0_9ACTN|nr:hypothetical protein [Thermomonospora echinospora]SEG24906.1 hypothetical protein SAMN04489712_10477 [Thermomonospora echinospora]
MPDLGPFHAVSWEPIYAGKPVTRQGRPLIPDGKRRVVREQEEASRRIADGSLKNVPLVDGTWN